MSQTTFDRFWSMPLEPPAPDHTVKVCGHRHPTPEDAQACGDQEPVYLSRHQDGSLHRLKPPGGMPITSVAEAKQLVADAMWSKYPPSKRQLKALAYLIDGATEPGNGR